MNPEVIKVLAELGVGAVALLMFYKIINKILTDRRKDRNNDSELWRTEIKEGRTEVQGVLKELTSAINTANQIEALHERTLGLVHKPSEENNKKGE